MARVFVSYAQPDRRFARRIVHEVAANGHEVWWDQMLLPGENFRSEIDNQIARADTVIVLWSKHSVQSSWVQAEADHAYKHGKLIALRIGSLPIDRVPKPFGAVHVGVWSNFALVHRAIVRRIQANTSTTAPVVAESVGDLKTKVDPFNSALMKTSPGAPRDSSVARKVLQAAFDDIEAQRTFLKYLKLEPDGEYAEYARHRIAAFQEFTRTGCELEPNPRVDAKVVDLLDADALSRVIMLLYGSMDYGGPFWCYVAIKPSKFDAFKEAEAAHTIDLINFDDFGEVIVSAEGQEPPPEVTAKIAEMYGANVDTFFKSIDPIAEIAAKIAQMRSQGSAK